jgi:hypothetical protein
MDVIHDDSTLAIVESSSLDEGTVIRLWEIGKDKNEEDNISESTNHKTLIPRRLFIGMDVDDIGNIDSLSLDDESIDPDNIIISD